MNKKPGGIILSPYCSNCCVFCGVSTRRTEQGIKRQEVKVYKNLIHFKKRGIKKIEISGGDPIEYDKIIPLIKYIKKIGFKFVQLSTHGMKLSDESFLNELILSGVDRIRIPLYGSNAKIHDSVTQNNGSFYATLKGIKKLLEKAPDIEIQISCLVVKQNKHNLLNLIDLVKGVGVSDFYFSVPCVSNNDYSYYIPLKDLGHYARKVHDYTLRTDYRARFMEIPYCVFGYFNQSMNNTVLPPNMGKYCQPPEELKSPLKDLPSYRIKKKIDMCSNCKCSGICDGFFVNDIDKFGTGNLKPIK